MRDFLIQTFILKKEHGTEIRLFRWLMSAPMQAEVFTGLIPVLRLSWRFQCFQTELKYMMRRQEERDSEALPLSTVLAGESMFWIIILLQFISTMISMRCCTRVTRLLVLAMLSRHRKLSLKIPLFPILQITQDFPFWISRTVRMFRKRMRLMSLADIFPRRLTLFVFLS